MDMWICCKGGIGSVELGQDLMSVTMFHCEAGDRRMCHKHPGVSFHIHDVMDITVHTARLQIISSVRRVGFQVHLMFKFSYIIYEYYPAIYETSFQHSPSNREESWCSKHNTFCDIHNVKSMGISWPPTAEDHQHIGQPKVATVPHKVRRSYPVNCRFLHATVYPTCSSLPPLRVSGPDSGISLIIEDHRSNIATRFESRDKGLVLATGRRGRELSTKSHERASIPSCPCAFSFINPRHRSTQTFPSAPSFRIISATRSLLLSYSSSSFTKVLPTIPTFLVLGVLRISLSATYPTSEVR